jgi:PAS domain S-box-containing protein
VLITGGEVEMFVNPLSLASLRVRLMLLALVCLLPATVLLFYNVVQERSAAALFAREDALRVARKISTDYEEVIGGTRQLLTGLSQVPAIRVLNVAVCGQLLAGILRESSRYTNLAVVTPTGAIVCSGVPLVGPVNVADQSYFRQTLNQWGFTVSEYSADPVTGTASITIGYPVLDAARVAHAFLFAGLDLSRAGHLAETQLPAGSTFTLVDRSGTIMARYPEGGQWVGQRMSDAPIIRFALTQRGEGSVELTGLDGVRRLYVVTPFRGFPDERFESIVGIPVDVAFAEVSRALHRSLIWLAVVSGLALLTAWVGGNVFILRRTRALLQTTRRLREGDLSARTGLAEGRGELDQLGQAFDEMAAALEAREAAAKRMEATLRASSNAVRAVIHASPLAIVVLDHDGKITAWNPAAQRIFGWSAEEVLGQAPPFIAEDDQTEASALRHGDRSGEAHGGLEMRLQRKDGTLINVSLWTAPLRDSTDECVGFLTLYQDVTERKRAEEGLLTRTQQLEAFRHVGVEIVRELNLSELLTLIHRRAMELVGADGGSLFLWDEPTQRLVPQVWHGIPDGLGALALGLGEGLGGAVAQRGKGMIVNDYRASPYAHPRFVGETTVTAAMAEPLHFREKLIGVILVNHQADGQSFVEEDQRLLRLFADQATIAIQNARLYGDAERHRREIEIVADLSQGLNASLDFDTVLQRVVEAARDLTGSDLGQIALRDEPSDTLVFRYRAGSHSKRLDTHRIERGKGIGGVVMATGKPFRTDNYAEDPRITKEYLAHTLAEDVVAELAVPILMEGRVQGVLFVDNRSARPFSDRDERTLLRLAEHAAIAIRNARFHATALHRAQQLGTLNTVMRAMTTELDPLLVVRRILEAVQILIRGAAAILLEQPEGVDALRVVASVGLRDSNVARLFHLRVGEGLAGIATATRHPVVSTGIAWDPRFVNRSWAASEGLVAGILLPLVYADRVVGILGVFLRRLHTFPEEEVDLLQALAAQSAIALENARLFEKVDLGRERLMDLTQRVVSAQEEERTRLSRELHDEAGQALTALRISLGLIRGDLPAGETSVHGRLDDTMGLTESITDQLRSLAQRLRPPALDAVGLDATLEGLCRDFNRRTQLAIEYVGADLPPVADTVGIHLYRFLQEALTNVGKHAQAHRVLVALTYDGEMISLSVEDDGVGFDPVSELGGNSRGRIGLIGMRERLDLLKGRLEIMSRPGRGTCFVARVPWRAAP